jgi:hypothetical protein
MLRKQGQAVAAESCTRGMLKTAYHFLLPYGYTLRPFSDHHDSYVRKYVATGKRCPHGIVTGMLISGSMCQCCAVILWI